MDHLRPITSGYGFDARGVNRLHYVGRVEQLQLVGKRCSPLIYIPPQAS